MALIKCPECGSEISDKAVRCPNCGIPAKVWNGDTSYASTQPAVKENIRKQETVVQKPAVGKKKGMISKTIVAILVIVCLLGIALKVIMDYTNNENTGTTEITNIDMGAIGNKITVDGTVAYVAGENKILVPYDFYGNFDECRSAANSKSLAGCKNPRLPTDETDDLPEEVAREIISFYGEVGGFWTSMKADHATIEIVGQEPPSVHYAGIMKNYLETDKDGVTWPKWGYCLSRIDDTARMGLLVLYDVIVDEFEFTDVEDTADPNYSTEYKTQMDLLNEKNDDMSNEIKQEIQSLQQNSQQNYEDIEETSQVTADELKKIEEMLNTNEVNGFVSRNIFNTVEDIDLNLVFREYNYGEAHAKEIDNEYLLEYDVAELHNPLSVVSTKEIKETYKKYTGKDISDSEIKSRLHFRYLPKYDVYCDMHGDTNRQTVKCVNGIKKSDNIYVITIEYETVEFDTNRNKIVPTSTLTLKENGDSYVFMSNIKNVR